MVMAIVRVGEVKWGEMETGINRYSRMRLLCGMELADVCANFSHIHVIKWNSTT